MYFRSSFSSRGGVSKVNLHKYWLLRHSWCFSPWYFLSFSNFFVISKHLSWTMTDKGQVILAKNFWKILKKWNEKLVYTFYEMYYGSSVIFFSFAFDKNDLTPPMRHVPMGLLFILIFFFFIKSLVITCFMGNFYF